MRDDRRLDPPQTEVGGAHGTDEPDHMTLTIDQESVAEMLHQVWTDGYEAGMKAERDRRNAQRRGKRRRRHVYPADGMQAR